MAIEVISIYVLGLIAVGVISYLAGRWKGNDERLMLDAKATGLEYSYKEKCRKYDELHDALLRVNKMNKELNKKVLSLPPTYEDCADDMVTMLDMGFSRHGIAKKYGVCYSTVCYWIRKKQAERSKIRADNVTQGTLI